MVVYVLLLKKKQCLVRTVFGNQKFRGNMKSSSRLGDDFCCFCWFPPPPFVFAASLTTLLHHEQDFYMDTKHSTSPVIIIILAPKRMVPCHQGCHCITVFQTLQRNYMPLTSLARRSYSSISLSFSWLTFSTLQMRLAAVSACWAPEKAW